MKKFKVTLFVLGLSFHPDNTRTVEVEAETQEKAEQIAHDKYASDGWGVYDSKETVD